MQIRILPCPTIYFDCQEWPGSKQARFNLRTGASSVKAILPGLQTDRQWRGMPHRRDSMTAPEQILKNNRPTCQANSCVHNRHPECGHDWNEMDSSGTCIFLDERKYRHTDAHSLKTWIENPERHDSEGAKREWQRRFGTCT